MNVWEQIRESSVWAAAFLGLGCSMMFAQNAAVRSTSSPAAVSDSASALGPRFDVASVRQNLTPEPRWRMSFTDDGVSAKDVTLFYAIEEAYGLYEAVLVGHPAVDHTEAFRYRGKVRRGEISSHRFGAAAGDVAAALGQRFKLVVHHQPKEFPLYALRIAKGGPRFEETKPEDLKISSAYGPMCQVLRSKMGLTEMKGCSMAQLAQNLTGWTRNDLGRTIVDHTGLAGRYNFSLSWTPDTTPPPNSLDGEGGHKFIAVQEQLG